MTRCHKLLDDRRFFSSDAESDRVRVALTGWCAANGIARKLIQNLCCDPRLPDHARAEIMNAFASHPPSADWAPANNSFSNRCRNHQKAGGFCAHLPSDRHLWHAVDEDSLRNRLDQKGWKPEQIAKLIPYLKSRSRVPPDRWRGIPRTESLGPWQMWATWGPSGDCPFPDPRVETWFRADHVRACLGLDDFGRGKPLFLIGYRLPDEWTAWIPTVADAESYPYFRPSPFGPYGLTDPWHPRPDLPDQAGKPFAGTPRPEVIHDPICANDIHDVKVIRK